MFKRHGANHDIYFNAQKGGKVYARVPDLNGCITTGRDLSDAIEQMADAMAAWLCAAEDEGLHRKSKIC